MTTTSRLDPPPGRSRSSPQDDTDGGASDPTEIADEEILRASRSQPVLFAALFDRHWPAIHRYCVARLGAAGGEDAASETFTIAFDQRDRFDPARGRVRSWLFGIAANLIRRHHRSAGRAAAGLRRLAGRADAEADDYAAQAATSDEAARVRVLIEGLRPAEREPLLLAAWADLTYPEIAEALDVPIGTVRSRISRARTKINRQLPPTT